MHNAINLEMPCGVRDADMWNKKYVLELMKYHFSI